MGYVFICFRSADIGWISKLTRTSKSKRSKIKYIQNILDRTIELKILLHHESANVECPVPIPNWLILKEYPNSWTN